MIYFAIFKEWEDNLGSFDYSMSVIVSKIMEEKASG